MKRGRKPKEIDVTTAEKLAGIGMPLPRIAAFFSLKEDAFRIRMKQDQTLGEAIERGRAKGVASMVSKLWDKAQDGDTKAIIFWLRCRGDFVEKTALDVTNSDGTLKKQPFENYQAMVDAINRRIASEQN